MTNEDRQLCLQILQCKGYEISIPHVSGYANFLKSCNLNFCTRFKVRSIRGFEVALTARINLIFFFGSTGIVIDCVIEFNTHSTQKYQ
jgi:hypothetical protein